MKVRIKDWDDAVKSALEDSADLYVDIDSIIGIPRKWGSWGEIVDGYKDGKYFHCSDHFQYPLCTVEEIDDNNIWRYGEIITDDQLHTINVDIDHRLVAGDVRIRLISCNGDLYYHKMVNGDLIECRKVGKANA